MAKAKNRVKQMGGNSSVIEVDGNGARHAVELMKPWTAKFTLRGVSDALFHAYDVADVQAKADAKRGDAIKKQDNVEAYIKRDKEGYICLPGNYIHGSMKNAAKRKQDPSSSRKSAYDLFKAAIFPSQTLFRIYPSGSTKPTKTWDQLDTRRVVVNHSAVPRTRPMFYAGWSCEASFEVAMPELVSPAFFREVLEMAGKFVGIADHRPEFGRFAVDSFQVIKG